MSSPDAKSSVATSLSVGRRLLWLIACAATGLGIGVAGHHFTADQAWFLAFPIVYGLGWLFIADPSQCLLVKNGENGKSADCGSRNWP